ncbi:hypothetical protein OYT13_16845 [Pandoraea sp. XJJ-1]|uniref:DUF6414 family protein n=1 Tax=Pandoraea sp. XJJ-1 TaxID=3002643 RepID=UPI00227FFFD1|nr:hypothetical protein [Pandoraea sp. XJJ-1]WAL81506.1 hypothetical protein OYT13_16845 [Pandoraea sp. XJJ-1]
MEQGSQNIDSIYDFLYIDSEKLKYWFSQLFDGGLLTSTKSSAQSSEGATSQISGKVDGNGEKNALILKARLGASLGGQLGATNSATEAFEHLYDAHWTRPISVLDRLDEFDFIERDLARAGIGGLVLCSGVPQLLDVKFMQNIWKPGINLMTSDIKPTHKNRAEFQSARKQLDSIGDILNVMPPMPQIYFSDKEGRKIWACLKEENMLVSTASLTLAHGSQMRGEWHMVAVLDAVPDETDVAPSVTHANAMIESVSTLLSSVREMVGRTTDAYAITPIMIFRVVTKRTSP